MLKANVIGFLVGLFFAWLFGGSFVGMAIGLIAAFVVGLALKPHQV